MSELQQIAHLILHGAEIVVLGCYLYLHNYTSHGNYGKKS